MHSITAHHVMARFTCVAAINSLSTFDLTGLSMAILHDLQTRVIAALFLAVSSSACAQDAALTDAQWILSASPGLTYHYSSNPEHRTVALIGLERYSGNQRFWGGDRSLWGAAYFSNSFGQPSGYAYYGGVTDSVLGNTNFFFKWTAGVIYGYRPPYQDKVPLNRNGWSPGLVPGLGYKFTPDASVQLNVLGAAALMLTLNYRLK
jgi:hypothetical protein